MFIGFTLSWSI
jgi:hypothetical protein